MYYQYSCEIRFGNGNVGNILLIKLLKNFADISFSVWWVWWVKLDNLMSLFAFINSCWITRYHFT